MAVKIQLRRDTAANWTTANPVLAQGEAGYEIDTGKLKIGDGTKDWTTLGYVSGGASVTVGTVAPTSPADGAMWFDTNGTGTLKVYWGTNPAGASWENAVDVPPAVWTRAGTTLSPATAGDVVEFSAGTEALPGLTPVGDPDTGLYSPGANEVAFSANGSERMRLNNAGVFTLGNGTTNAVTLDPGTTGSPLVRDSSGRLLVGTATAPAGTPNGSVTVAQLASTVGIGNVAVNADGTLVRQALPFSWDANTDNYIRVAVADRDINAQARMRRCLVTDAGAVTYLDADDSTKLAGDWVRLCETTELSVPNTGSHGAEVQNNGLRALASTWAAGTYTKGAVVTDGGSVWECVAATTTAQPAAGASAATLDGTAGQVMVEIPLFSVRHVATKVGTYFKHEHAVALGEVKGGGYEVHPAFVKPDGSLRSFIYVGAYKGTGGNGNGSASGVNNAVNFKRSAARTAMAGRGTGWHQYSYWQWNAIQHLYLAEYQDMNSQRVLGDGSMVGATYVVNTGLSNARGNRCGNVTGGTAADYMSYRGVENFYGRAWDWIDGINVNERMVYLCNDPSKFADSTSTGYAPIAMVPAGGGTYQRDVMSGLAMLPSSVAGASATTHVGDALWTNVGWCVASVGGSASPGPLVGAWCLRVDHESSHAAAYLGGRLAYAP